MPTAHLTGQVDGHDFVQPEIIQTTEEPQQSASQNQAKSKNPNDTRSGRRGTSAQCRFVRVHSIRRTVIKFRFDGHRVPGTLGLLGTSYRFGQSTSISIGTPLVGTGNTSTMRKRVSFQAVRFTLSGSLIRPKHKRQSHVETRAANAKPAANALPLTIQIRSRI